MNGFSREDYFLVGFDGESFIVFFEFDVSCVFFVEEYMVGRGIGEDVVVGMVVVFVV